MVRWLLVIALSGCSLALSGPDPDRPRGKPPTCDTGKGAVGIDGVLGSTMLLTGLVVAGDNGGGEAALPLLLAAAFYGSAVHGNSVVDSCRTEMAAFAESRDNQEVEQAAERAAVARQARPTTVTQAPSMAPTVATAPPAVPVLTPPPVSSPPVPAPVPAPAAHPAPPAHQTTGDRWADFWREVP